jgi:hypothetical protein
MEFRKRESTTKLYICYEDTAGLSITQLRRKARRSGEFDVGFHFYVADSGEVEEGRSITEIAGHTLPDCESSIYVLVDTTGRANPSDSAFRALKALITSIKKMYPQIVVAPRK